MPELKGSGIHVVQLKNTSATTVNWQSCIEIEITGTASPKFLKSGDILFVARGNNNYAVLVDSSINTSKMVAAPHFYIIRTNTDKVLPQFLVCLLNQKPIQQCFKREAEGTLAKSIRRSVLENVEVILPSLDEQHKVAQLTSTIQRQQDTYQQLIDNGNQIMSTIAYQLHNRKEIRKP